MLSASIRITMGEAVTSDPGQVHSLRNVRTAVSVRSSVCAIENGFVF